MKNLILFITLSAMSSLYGQQTEGLKIEKASKMSMERKITVKSNDSIAKSNLNDMLRQKSIGNSILGTANPHTSEIQLNVDKLQYKASSFNNNADWMITPQDRGIQIHKSK
ncbi:MULTISPECIES: hypothetical protein [unclassified Chryseobacterium]|uniref:hypothetical protein n=1 Tax=unclassified Chryseobacterium TaxID=2593645 RepID=UPI002269C1B6|nr:MULTISPECIES: hypothetical protein [unclassified Chryseobacterium]